MLARMPIETLLVSGYAGFLLLVAVLLEQVSKHSRKRTERLELVGFRYLHELDRWECPIGTQLIRIHQSAAPGIQRYRAPAHSCNSCSTKHSCTDSHEGREIEYQPDLWVQAGVKKFHSGISLTLLLLAAVLLAFEAIRFPNSVTLLIASGLFLPIVWLGLRLLTFLRGGAYDRTNQVHPIH